MSVCSGGGGLDLGLRLAVPSARTVCYVENEATAIEVLVARMEEGFLDQAPVWTDLRSFDGKPWRGAVDVLLGGYPCPPFSIAGKRRGKDDPRHLWPFVAERIREIQPGLCFFENVSNHLTLGFDEVKSELQGMGYRVEAGLFTAAETGAPHLRRRLFILASLEPMANAVGIGVGGGDQRGPEEEGEEARQREDGAEVADELGDGGEALDDAPGSRLGSGEPGQGREGRDEARRKEPERRGGPVAGDEHVGDTPVKGLEVGARLGEDVGQELEAIVRAGRGVWGIKGKPSGHVLSARGAAVPIYPPGPSSREWASVIHEDPSLEPSVRNVADELAGGVGQPTRSRRADQIRLLGNGVVPSCAALAFLSLLSQSEAEG
jgi:DNA (cytosine-5)-methyltransferase 1